MTEPPTSIRSSAADAARPFRPNRPRPTRPSHRSTRRFRGPAAGLVLGAVLLPVLAACGGDDGPALNVYSHRHYDVDRQIFERFEEETGIEVRVVSAGADELVTRLEREGARSPADVLITVDAGRLHRAQERGLLQPVESTVLDEVIPDHLRDPEGHWFGFTTRARILAYHRDRVDPENLERYEQLSDGIWEDRILTRSSSNIYNVSLLASVVAHEGPEAAEAWAQGVVDNLARSPQGNDTDQIRDVAAGVGDVAIVNSYYIGRLLHREGEAGRELVEQVGIAFPNQGGRGTHVNVSGAGVTTHAPNRDHAVRFLEFMAGEWAQELFAQANFEYPVREGVDWHSTLEEWGDFKADTLPMARLGEHHDEAVRIFDRVGWR